ncbi:glycosyltransferase [Bacteroides sp.]|uniref:glycosyltransferase n=1 Tax=Bacteroides sp. TaxID=29523 RepID=UPI003AB3E1F7
MKKVVLFTSSLNVGGIERVFLTYAGMLADAGYDITYLVCYDSGTLLNQVPANVRLYSLGTNKLRISLLAFARFIRDNKPDVILCASTATIIVYFAVLLSRIRVKIITSHHNFLNVDVVSYIDKKVIWKFYNQCSSVIAVSKGIYDLLIKHRVKEEKIHLIYNPVDIKKILLLSNEYSERLPDNYILFVGRLSKVKNLPFLLSAFNNFCMHIPNVPLVIVGDGPEKEDIVGLSKGIDGEIKFVGNVSNPYPYINKASVIVLSSLSEAFPTVLLESMALGKTIVSTPTQGALEILEKGKFGYLSKDFHDAFSFSTLLIHAYKFPLKKDVLIEGCVRYSMDNSLRQLLSLF